jgi:hypothetical protein
MAIQVAARRRARATAELRPRVTRVARGAWKGEDVIVEFGHYDFGSIEIDGATYEHDVVIDAGRVRRRDKAPSKALGTPGHTPLSAAEEIPWSCHRLVIGSGAAGALPVLDTVPEEARRRGVELVVVPTFEAIELLRSGDEGTNAILHVTC